MLSGFYPYFSKGRVLKKENVEYLRDFPYELALMAYEHYSDGVLYGFNVSHEGDDIRIGNGALIHKGGIIMVNKSTVTIEEYGQTLNIRLYVGKSRETEDYKLCPTEINIDKRVMISENEIELGSFCLNKGAELRTKYDSFDDMRTPENTLDITRVAYAGEGAPTLHPTVMKEFAKEVLARSKDEFDVSFALMCLNSGIVSKSVIQYYIAKKNNADYTDYMLQMLYDKLYDILPEYGQKNTRKRAVNKGPRIEW